MLNRLFGFWGCGFLIAFSGMNILELNRELIRDIKKLLEDLKWWVPLSHILSLKKEEFEKVWNDFLFFNQKCNLFNKEYLQEVKQLILLLIEGREDLDSLNTEKLSLLKSFIASLEDFKNF